MAGWLVPLLALVWLQQPARLVGNSPGWKGHLRWSPDGNQFLFTIRAAWSWRCNPPRVAMRWRW